MKSESKVSNKPLLISVATGGLFSGVIGGLMNPSYGPKIAIFSGVLSCLLITVILHTAISVSKIKN